MEVRLWSRSSRLKTAAHAAGMVVPSDLLVVADGTNYVRLAGSRFWLCKLVCPEAAKSVKNISLAGTKQMKALMESVWCAFLAPVAEEGEPKPNLFEETKWKRRAAKERDLASPPRLKK